MYINGILEHIMDDVYVQHYTCNYVYTYHTYLLNSNVSNFNNSVFIYSIVL